MAKFLRFSAILLWTLLTVVGPSAAQAKKRVESSPALGFKTLWDPSTPAAVIDAAVSVFEIRMVSEEPSKYFTNLEQIGAENLRERILNSARYDNHEKLVFERQIDHCLRESLLEKCPLMMIRERGTGFLLGAGGRSFWTNAHVVARYLKMLSQLEGVSVDTLLEKPVWLPLFLFNNKGELVVDPFVHRPMLVKVPSLTRLAQTRDSFYAEDSDYVMIELAVPIGEPLEIAATLNIGEPVSRLGYPACTNCSDNKNEPGNELKRDRGENKNSSGKILYWTSGKVQTDDWGLEFLNQPRVELVEDSLRTIFFYDADGQHGMSGGPVLNDAGEVIGLHSGNKGKLDASGELRVLSRAVRPAEFN